TRTRWSRRAQAAPRAAAAARAAVRAAHRRHPMSAETGVIHDIGYRRYTGRRLGRPQIVRALYWHSLRSAFGLGRGAKAKIVPVITFVVICLPAVANAVAVARGSA